MANVITRAEDLPPEAWEELERPARPEPRSGRRRARPARPAHVHSEGSVGDSSRCRAWSVGVRITESKSADHINRGRTNPRGALHLGPRSLRTRVRARCRWLLIFRP